MIDHDAANNALLFDEEIDKRVVDALIKRLITHTPYTHGSPESQLLELLAKFLYPAMKNASADYTETIRKQVIEEQERKNRAWPRYSLSTTDTTF